MNPLSDFEQAQERVKSRQHQKGSLLIWIFAVLSLLVILIATGNVISGCLFPSLLGAIVMAGVTGKRLLIKEYAPDREEIEQEREMDWLFGENWHVTTGSKEYILAADRVRSFRRNRELFLLHILVFFPINGFLLLVSGTLKDSGNNNDLTKLLNSYNGLTTFGTLWLMLLFFHAINAYPPEWLLKRRETHLGKTLLHEIKKVENLYEMEKPKRQYTVGDDGELVEVEADEALEDDKPKREQRG